MAESITYDFISRGADRLAGDFRKTGDNAALAARGAKVLQDVIGRLGEKENRTAAESANLAKALRLTGDAEDRMAAKALAADIAVRRLADAEQAASRRNNSLCASLAGLGPLAGRTGAFSLLAGGAAALAAPIGAAAVAVAGFGILAAPTLVKVKDALTKTGAAGTKAWAQLDPAQRSIAKNLQVLEGQFGQMAKAFEPVVASVIGGLAKLAGAFLPSLAPLAQAGAQVITAIATPLTALVKSGLFRQFIAELSQVAIQAGKLLGPLLVTALKAFIILFTALAPAGLQVLAALQPLVAVLGDALAKILPPLGKAFANIVIALLPLVPAVTAVAAGLALVIAAIPPGVLTKVAEAFLAVVGAVKAWSIAQAALDVLLEANPIALVITAIALLAAGFVIAWKKSALFRDIIKDIGVALLAAGIVVVQGAKIIVDAFLSMVGTIIHGAALAFGWVPGLGGKLRGAAKDFDNFKASTDNVFNGMIKTMQGWQGELGRSRQVSNTASAAILRDFQGQSAAARRGRDDMVSFTNAVVFSGAKSNQARSARVNLIRDLENSGASASQAKRLVDNLQASVNRLHGKTVNVLLHAAGSGSIYFNQSTGVGGSVKGGLKFFARGGTGPALAVVGEQGPELVSLPPGARVYSHGQSKAMIPGIPGFASGGYVPNYPGAQDWMGGNEYGFGKTVENNYAVRLIGQLKTAVARAAAQAAATARAGLNNLPLGLGPHSGSAAVAQAFARSILFAYGWGQNQFPPLQALWNQESGWNSYAVNPSSGAYGIPQALGKGHPYNLGDYQAQIRWGLSYIWSRYGSPAAAEGHELAFNWYDKGGLLKPGLTLAYNGTGRPEQVIPAGGSAGGGVHLHLTVNGPVGSQQQLEDWFVKTANHTARTGRLTQAVARAGR